MVKEISSHQNITAIIKTVNACRKRTKGNFSKKHKSFHRRLKNRGSWFLLRHLVL
ncbi:hypothetical protein HMPREF7215_0297 [Pyramidobacter piscolens W5455]|uniref:Uncharacterized protein n=1 Tax=Pyramidobacter piscolens W5455 TaxID=352165 RepID=A0ABP2HVD3_9BACT|nr:hypothetical protein HMPREF7215_0297 [Pyramidobacter piscolens W5455]